MMTPTENHLTVKQTAEILGVHPRTVRRYMAAGRLTVVRHPLSRRVYLRESEVHARRDAAMQAVYGLRKEGRSEGV